MNWTWPGEPHQEPVEADVDRYWLRAFREASGWQPWWRRVWAWLARANRR